MGSRRILTPEATDALEHVTAARAAQLAEVERARSAAERLVADLTRDAEQTLARAVHTALALGVPHTRVGKEGLGTTDWDTVDGYAERGAPVAA